MDEATQASAKPWSWTAAEAASTEAALVPFLVHLATARNDAESLEFCLSRQLTVISMDMVMINDTQLLPVVCLTLWTRFWSFAFACSCFKRQHSMRFYLATVRGTGCICVIP